MALAPSSGIEAARRFMFEPRLPLWRYVLLAVPLAMLPSLLLAWLAWTLTAAAGIDTAAHAPPALEPGLSTLLGVTLLAPVVETLLLGGMIGLLSRVIRSAVAVAVTCALLWGVLHGLAGALWFAGTVWSFFVFSAAWIAWRPRSRWHAFAASASTHALLNLLVMAMALAGSTLDPTAPVDAAGRSPDAAAPTAAVPIV